MWLEECEQTENVSIIYEYPIVLIFRLYWPKFNTQYTIKHSKNTIIL